jgi:hypothetical protein
MSEQLHPTRLEWDGRRGFARHDGVEIVLRDAPSKQWAEVHFTPGIQAEVRERSCDARRDMVAAEIRSATRWLEHMAYAARSSIGEVPRPELWAPSAS